jgi:drug/metabolite transporter (DMT)-like permease
MTSNNALVGRIMTLPPGVRFMLLSTFAFSLMQLCVKFLPHLPATELVLFRSIISLSISLVYLKRIGVSPWGNNKVWLVLRGLFGITALSMFFYTLQNMPLASAVTLQYLSPLFTAVMAIFILKEPMAPAQWFFFGLALVGVFVLKGFDPRIETFYVFLGIGSAFFAGLAYNCIRKVKDTDHPVVVVFYFPLIATPIMAVISLFNWVMPTGIDWIILLGMGLFTQVGQVYMTKALQAEKANKVTTLKYLGALYAIGYGFFFFGEVYSWGSILGIALILSGVILNIISKKKV